MSLLPLVSPAPLTSPIRSSPRALHNIVAVRAASILVPLLLVVLLGGSTVTQAQQATVNFTNSGTGMRYVFVVEGPDGSQTSPCMNKKTILPVFGLGNGQSRSVTASVGTTVCYALSMFETPSQPPYFTGVAANGANIDVANQGASTQTAKDSTLMVVLAGQRYPWPITWPRQQPWFTDIFPPAPPSNPNNTVGIETTIAVLRDPFTPPQTRTRCTSEAWGEWWPGGPQWRSCNGYATDCQWMERRLILSVTLTAPTLSRDTVRKVIDECLQTAAGAAALTALVGAITGGAGVAAAEAAFVATLQACIVGKISNVSGLNIQIRNEGGWTGWTAC